MPKPARSTFCFENRFYTDVPSTGKAKPVLVALSEDSIKRSFDNGKMKGFIQGINLAMEYLKDQSDPRSKPQKALIDKFINWVCQTEEELEDEIKSSKR